MSTVAQWAGLGVNAGMCLISAIFFKPVGKNALEPAKFEYHVGHFAYGWAALVGVVRFLAEVYKFGRWPLAPASYVTSWVRYVGAGLSATAFMTMLCAIGGGGLLQLLAVPLSVASYYAALTFAALAFETQAAVIAFFTIASVVWLYAFMKFFSTDTAKNGFMPWIPTMSFIVEAGIITVSGLDLFNANITTNSLSDWLFFGLNVGQLVWYMFVYLVTIDETWLSAQLSSPDSVYV